MFSRALFRVVEYGGPAVEEPNEIPPVYRSLPMCLKDASSFAAPLSYARGAYVRVVADTAEETYQEWWRAGAIWRQTDVPPVRKFAP